MKRDDKPAIDLDMVEPRHLKKKPLDRSKDTVHIRFPREIRDYLQAHGVNVSAVCRDALMSIYQDLLAQRGPKVPKR